MFRIVEKSEAMKIRSLAVYSVIICLILVVTTKGLSQLQWNGPDNQTDFISRTGPVNINGNVGLGTGMNTPIGKLQINGSTVFSGSQGAFVLTSAYEAGDHFISIAPNAGGTYQTSWDWTKALGFLGTTGELQKSITNNSDIAFSVVGSASSKNLKLYGSGNIESNGDAYIKGKIVIGNVQSPSGYKLFVEEGILAQKVKVALPSSIYWMDGVFNSNYNLKSIDSVRAFIEKYRHLPGMPSGDELYKSGGVDVLEMLRLQQQKIEELTLYVIQLNDEIKKLKNE